MFPKKIINEIHSIAIFLIAFVLTFSTIGVTPVYATSLIVTSSANNGPGTLRQAIADAASGSTITFDPSLSGATIYLDAPLGAPKQLTIDGSSLASRITISGDSDASGSGNVQVFFFSSGGNITLDSLIITRGWTSVFGYGGGIYISSGELTLKNSTVMDSYAGNAGGGIYIAGGIVTINNCTISGNTSNDGGGIGNAGILTVTNSTVSSNNASRGGGIHNLGAGALLTVTNSTLSGNYSNTNGGGIFSAFGTANIDNSRLKNNVAIEGGGGIYNAATLTVTNSTLSGNTADNGAGIYNYSSLIMTNSTISRNLADTDGGGIYNITNTGVAYAYNSSIVYNTADADTDINGGWGGGVYNYIDGASFFLIHSLVAGNSMINAPVYDDCYGTLKSYGRNLIGALSTTTRGSCSVITLSGSWAKLNNLDLLGILQNNGGPTATIALLPGSNAIDSGDPTYGCTDYNGYTITTDQRGVARPQGIRCDIGAFEYVDPNLSLTVLKNGTGSGTVTSSPSGINCGLDCSESYVPNTLVTLSAAPAADSLFIGWSGACSGTGGCTVTMTEAKSVTATFNLKQFYDSSQGTGAFSYNAGWRVDQHPRMLADVNGDGKDDAVGFGYAGVYVALANASGTGFAPTTTLWTGAFSYNAGWRVDQHPRMLADVNGDGKADAVGFGYAGVYVALANASGTGFAPTTTLWTGAFSYNAGWRVDQHPRMLADVNGDGKADAVGFGYAGVYVALANAAGDGFAPTASQWTGAFSYNAGWRVDQHPRMLADVNGDGKADAVGFGYAGVYVALANASGTGFAPSTSQWTGAFSYNAGWRVDQHPRMLADVNGDGRADAVGYGNTGISVALANAGGTGFEAGGSLWTNAFSYGAGWRVDQHPRMFADVNGDGKDDAVGFGYAGVFIAQAK